MSRFYEERLYEEIRTLEQRVKELEGELAAANAKIARAPTPCKDIDCCMGGPHYHWPKEDNEPASV